MVTTCPCTPVQSCKTIQAAGVASINPTTPEEFGLVLLSLMCSQQSLCGAAPEAPQLTASQIQSLLQWQSQQEHEDAVKRAE